MRGFCKGHSKVRDGSIPPACGNVESKTYAPVRQLLRRDGIVKLSRNDDEPRGLILLVRIGIGNEKGFTRLGPGSQEAEHSQTEAGNKYTPRRHVRKNRPEPDPLQAGVPLPAISLPPEQSAQP